MKARFFAIAALVLGLASCQKDFNAEVNSASEVDFKFSVAAPELAKTRAGDTAEKPQNAKDSAFGAIDYFQGADWNQVDLRYTLEVYDYRADGNYAGQTPVKDRMAIVLDSYEAATFELRLAPKRDYHFVVFADFVEDGATAWSELDKLTKDGLRHRIGDTLASIELIDVVGEELNDEKSDAYFATAKINPSNNTTNKESILLTRPYAKVRVVATDLHELNLNVKPAKVQVVYDALNANTFNAVEGTISGTYAKNDFTYTYTDPHVYTAGYDAKTIETVNGDVRNTHMTLFTDYILAKDEQEAIQFVMTVFDDKDVIIKETNFYTEIPVQRNHLTTIIGNVLTTGVDINVTINDNFANADNENIVFEAFVNGGEVTLDKDYTIGSTLFVEPGADVVLNLNGHKITNTKDNQSTDVIVVKEGGKLTINGEGSVEAVDGNDGYAVISNGELIINGGTYTSGCDENGESNAIIYARGNGKVYINGGIFNRDGSTNDGGFVLNKKDADRATTTIEVRGGMFRLFNPANNAAEGAGTNFVADGYGVIEDGDWYKVERMAVVTTVDEFNAASNDASIPYIRFGADINFGTATAYVNSDKVILADGHKLTAGGQTTKNYGLAIQGEYNVTINDLKMIGCGGIYMSDGAKLALNGAEMTPKYSSSGRYMFYIATEGTELTINSGDYSMSNTGIKYFGADGNATVGYGKINVLGGKFYGTQANNAATVFERISGLVKIYGGQYYMYPTRKFDPTPYLADGYKTVEISANWVEVVAE